MTPDNELIKNIVNTAKMNLKIGPELLACFFIINDSEKKIEIVASHMENERAKDFTAQAVGEVAKKIKADCIVFVAESYVVEGLKSPEEVRAAYEKYGRLEFHPDAKEKVIFTIETQTRQHTGMADVLPEREMGEINWMEPEEMQGRFSNLLGQKPTRH